MIDLTEERFYVQYQGSHRLWKTPKMAEKNSMNEKTMEFEN